MTTPAGPIGVVILGCGAIGETHVRALDDLPRARLVGISSRRLDRARAVAGRERCLGVADPQELLSRHDVHLAIVASSSGSHAELARAALRAGKHVLVEKPMAMTVTQAAGLCVEARAAGRLLSVVSQRRFEPQHRALRDAVAGGALGELLLIEAACPYFRSQEYYQSGDWRGTRGADGGALMNQGIHAVDLMLWLAGPVTRVHALTATRTHKIEMEDVAVVQAKFASGAFGQIWASTSVVPGFQPTLAVYGTRGSVRLEGATVVHWSVPGVAPPAATEAGASAGVRGPQLASAQHHRAQLADVLDAIDTKRAPAVTAEDGLRAVAFVQAAYRSADAGETIAVPSALDDLIAMRES